MSALEKMTDNELADLMWDPDHEGPAEVSVELGAFTLSTPEMSRELAAEIEQRLGNMGHITGYST